MRARTFTTLVLSMAITLLALGSPALAQEADDRAPTEEPAATCTQADANTSAELGKSLAAILRDGNNAKPEETACAEEVSSAARRTATVLGKEGWYWAQKGGHAFMGWVNALEEKQQAREDADE